MTLIRRNCVQSAGIAAATYHTSMVSRSHNSSRSISLIQFPKRSLSVGRKLKSLKDERERSLLQRRIERYLDQGYGEALLKNTSVAAMVQDSLLRFDGTRYKLFAWVVMPNHVHSLMTRFEDYELKDILHSLKSYTAHEANKTLHRRGQFWMEDYFDRYMRNQEHFRKTVQYIENNPVKARLCETPSCWAFSSAWFKKSR
jgi:REP element-mobilizing transposase RayT